MGKKKREDNEVNLNLTSMMDVVFLLIIFFILITNFTTNENPELVPPKFQNSLAEELDDKGRIMVNLVPRSGKMNAEPKIDYVYPLFLMAGNKRFEPKVDVEKAKMRSLGPDNLPNAREYFEYEDFTDILRQERAAKAAADNISEDEVQVTLRADGRIQYQYVAKVMEAIVKAGLKKVNIVAQIEED